MSDPINKTATILRPSFRTKSHSQEFYNAVHDSVKAAHEELYISEMIGVLHMVIADLTDTVRNGD